MRIKPNNFIALRSALLKALEDSFATFSRKEPSLVAALVQNIPLRVNALASSSFRIKAGGVFIHNQPKVIVNGKKTVELGDLLLLQTEKKNGEVFSQRALLLQAKMVSHAELGKGMAHIDNAGQRWLYSCWPEFEYSQNSHALAGQKRKLEGVDIYSGAQYLLLNKSDNVEFPYCDDLPCCLFRENKEPLCDKGQRFFGAFALPFGDYASHFTPIHNQLTAFIAGMGGKEYTRPTTHDVGWNRVIYDLISETAGWGTKYIVGRRRATGEIAFYSGMVDTFSRLGIKSPPLAFLEKATGQQGDGEPPLFRLSGWTNDYPGNGISIIEFVVSSEEG